jgi:flagellar hook-associated protein 2
VSSLALSGLASGVDTSSIVEQLMAVDRQATTKITNKQTRITGEQNALKGIAAKLTAFKSAVDALKADGGAWTQTQTVESTDTRVAVSKTSGAGAGGHSVQVDRLASSAQRGFSIGDLTNGSSLTVGSSTFTFSATATIDDIVSQINAKSDAPVYAAVVKNSSGDQRLVLSARTTGESSRFTVTSSTFTEDPAYASAPDSLNALYRLDGAATATPSESNVLDNAIPGLRLTLKGVTTSPASVTVSAADIDRTGAATKIKNVVTAYNALVDATRSELNEKSVPNATSTSDLQAGTLFGDTGLTSMLSKFRNDLRTTIGGLSGIDDLSDLGIGVPTATAGSSDDAKAGRFTVDDAKLNSALNADWTKVSAFMDAFAKKADALVDAQTGKTGSLLDGRVASDDTMQKTLAQQLTDLNARLDERETRLKAQFAAMETALQNAQTQQTWLTGQLNALG